MNRVHLDFETRSSCDLLACGAWNYSKHPSSEILCAAWAFEDEKPDLINFWNLKSKDLRELARDPNSIFVAHNAGFELYMWMHLMVPMGYPVIPLLRWRCTAAKMSAMGLPKSLANAGAALGLEIRKDSDGHAIMMRLCKPIPIPKNILACYEIISPDLCYDNDNEKFEKLFAYCKNDVEVERLIDKKAPDLSSFEQALWFATMQINMHGIRVDMELVKAVIGLSNELELEANTRIQEITNNELNTFNQVKAITKFVESRGFEISTLSVDELDGLITKCESDPVVKEVLTIRKNMARASVKKFYAFERNTDLEDNRIRDGLVYHLSHTGRWGSRGSQLLNLVKYSGNMDLLCHSIKTCDKEFLDAYWGSANHAISDAPRGALIASKDKDFFCVDFSAIEARTLFFIARDMRGLLQFMKKEDLYVSLARLIYEDETITKETHPDERQLGKQGVLGCGYQMGWERFIETCASYGMDVSEELAKKTVTMYREAYQPVVDFWWACDKAAKKAINYRTIVEVGPIAFGYSQGALMVRLPSGKFLYYHNPKVKKREVTEEQRADLIARGLEWKLEREVIVYSHQNDKNMWVTTHTYGGKLVENINQAVARDLLGYSLLNVMKTKRYTPLLLPHDELLTEGDPKECSVEELCELVCKLPPWAEGLPMAAEGWTGKRYRK